MEMPELCFNIVDGSWKIKRELRALNRDDLEKWMALINQAIDFANEQAAAKAHGGLKPLGLKVRKAANNGSRHSGSGSRERGNSRGSRGSRGSRDSHGSRKLKHGEERHPESALHKTEASEDVYEDPEDEVYLWLKAMSLQRFTATFKAKGFATVDFIREVSVCFYVGNTGRESTSN